MPVNPNTPGQSLARATLASASTAWRNLTASQRVGWASLGVQMVRTDSLGQTYNLTGLQAFTSIYRNLTTLGVATVTDAPALSAPVDLLTAVVTATAA